MAARKKQAERALEIAGRSQAVSGPSGDGGADAEPATERLRQLQHQRPHHRPAASPPALLHALKQAKAAGYTRYVSCYRSGGSGEHPKGRACDFAAQKSGFGGDATGGDRTYGNNLANYFLRNAEQARRAVRDLVPPDLAAEQRMALVQRRRWRPVQRPHQPRAPVGDLTADPGTPAGVPGSTNVAS